ncbi:MAG: hypothetical protein JWR63_2304 [Conexibacter sp.]|nr:hypothetical protein [Conexibacter sp.]
MKAKANASTTPSRFGFSYRVVPSVEELSPDELGPTGEGRTAFIESKSASPA